MDRTLAMMLFVLFMSLNITKGKVSIGEALVDYLNSETRVNEQR